MLSERIEWPRLENLFQRDVPSRFNTELECCNFVGDSYAHCPEVHPVAFVGVKEFGIVVVVVVSPVRTILELNNLSRLPERHRDSTGWPRLLRLAARCRTSSGGQPRAAAPHILVLPFPIYI